MCEITKKITAEGVNYFICKVSNEGERDGYWAFKASDVDSNGRLTKEYNGITGFKNDCERDTILSVICFERCRAWNADHSEATDMEKTLHIVEVHNELFSN